MAVGTQLGLGGDNSCVLCGVLRFNSVCVTGLVRLFLFIKLYAIGLDGLVLFRGGNPRVVFFFLCRGFSFRLFLLVPRHLSCRRPLPLVRSKVRLRYSLCAFPIYSTKVSRYPIRFRKASGVLPSRSLISSSLRFLLPLSNGRGHLTIPVRESVIWYRLPSHFILSTLQFKSPTIPWVLGVILSGPPRVLPFSRVSSGLLLRKLSFQSSSSPRRFCKYLQSQFLRSSVLRSSFSRRLRY